MSLAALVASHPLIEGLDPRHQEVLVRHAREARFELKDVILKEGAAATASYLILSGSVGLEVHVHGGNVQVASAGAGEVVGWSWLVPPSRWHFDARAKEPVHALVLDGEALIDECDRDPTLGYALARRFMRVITQRVEALRLQLVDMYGQRGAELPWA